MTISAVSQIVLASRNRKKIGEMADLLAPHGIDVKSAADFPDLPEVVEDGATFA
ncbi:MAG: non-canonical purine NTP pyrophosphatase, partial [Planctomycetaceae bacterium]